MPHSLRRLRPFSLLLALVLALLAFLSVTRTLSLRSELRSQVSAQLRDQLDDQLRQWEERVVGQLDAQLDQIAAEPEKGAEIQRRLQGQLPWFDSLYAWTLPHSLDTGDKTVQFPPQLVYPVPAPSESGWGIRTPGCLLATRFDLVPHQSGEELAPLVLRACAAESAATKLRVLDELAWHLQSTDGQVALALAVLERKEALPETTLRVGIGMGVSPFRLVTNRLQRAGLLEKLGRVDEAMALLVRTGVEIVALDATELPQVIDRIPYPIVRSLEEHGRTAEANQLRYSLGPAKRRMRAFQELVQRILPLPGPKASQPGRFVYDQYEETPYIVYFRPVREDLGAALVLDQPELVSTLLRALRRYRDNVVVIDTAGKRIAGADLDGPLAFTIELETLRHLKVGLRASAVEARARRLDGQWFVPLLVTALCLILGVVAIVADVRASTRQEALLRRQREFTTRVTHELRTPLAGIRIMAENLELGAYDSDAERADMARRIVAEADRLTARVQEVLDATREQKPPEPKPFDPEEALLAAIDHWGPRLETAGVALEADLDATDEVLGDADAIRDSVGCLLDNALKYRREDLPEPGVWLTLRQEGRTVEIAVEDNGLGVPADKRLEIFERFARVEGDNRGRAGGHGLGLYQVAQTVRRHKGTVVCTDGRDGGARFVIRLPAVG